MHGETLPTAGFSHHPRQDVRLEMAQESLKIKENTDQQQLDTTELYSGEASKGKEEDIPLTVRRQKLLLRVASQDSQKGTANISTILAKELEGLESDIDEWNYSQMGQKDKAEDRALPFTVGVVSVSQGMDDNVTGTRGQGVIPAKSNRFILQSQSSVTMSSQESKGMGTFSGRITLLMALINTSYMQRNKFGSPHIAESTPRIPSMPTSRPALGRLRRAGDKAKKLKKSPLARDPRYKQMTTCLATELIDEEANLSGEDSGDGDLEENLSDMLDGFIDDSTPLTDSTLARKAASPARRPIDHSPSPLQFLQLLSKRRAGRQQIPSLEEYSQDEYDTKDSFINDSEIDYESE